MEGTSFRNGFESAGHAIKVDQEWGRSFMRRLESGVLRRGPELRGGEGGGRDLLPIFCFHAQISAVSIFS